VLHLVGLVYIVCVVEIGRRMPRIDDAGDICLRRPRPTQGCRASDDDDDDDDDNNNNNNNNNNNDDDDESLNNLVISDPILLSYDAVWTGKYT